MAQYHVKYNKNMTATSSCFKSLYVSMAHMSHAVVGPPTMDGSWWTVLTKCGPLEKGMENHFSILALWTP